ncbi:uncharacterized protein LOC130529048, partial [Takifugu flavidus]|uniref:uncharacterized protein LOC130529048 n=1 Tax=Takifugu flavidus TaxID=433684 RepID=UPI0025443E9C
ELLVSHVVRLHGIPLDVVSDRGPQFTSKVWQAFCKGIGATVSLSSGYHPQSNGQAERANQALEAALRCVTTSNPASWSKFLPGWNTPSTPWRALLLVCPPFNVSWATNPLCSPSRSWRSQCRLPGPISADVGASGRLPAKPSCGPLSSPGVQPTGEGGRPLLTAWPEGLAVGPGPAPPDLADFLQKAEPPLHRSIHHLQHRQPLCSLFGSPCRPQGSPGLPRLAH